MKLIIIFKIDIPLIVNDLNIIKKQFSICIQANTAVNCFVGNIHIIEFCQDRKSTRLNSSHAT